MFASFMTNTWLAGTLIAIVAGVVGFFTVLRGSAFAAHAIPNGAFAGAAGAALLRVSPTGGLALFSVGGALAISYLGRRGRRDVATALAIVLMLGLGAFFLSLTREYEPELFPLLFGQILGVDSGDLAVSAAIGGLCLLAIALLYRPLMLSSVLPEVADAGGPSTRRLEVMFLLTLALATTMALPVVGALLIFCLLISPAAAAISLTSRPGFALALSVAIALATVWSAIALSYLSNLPVGFFVGSIAAFAYAAARGWAASPARPH